MVEGLELLTSQKENLKMDIDVFVQHEISMLLPKVISALENDDTKSIEDELTKVYSQIEKYLSEILEKSISKIEKESLQLNLVVSKNQETTFDPSILLPLITTIPMPPQIKIIVTALIGIVTTLLGGDDKETELENERRRAKALQISQITQDIRSRILSSILKQSKELIDQSFQKSIDEINKKIVLEKENINREENIKTLLNESKVKIDSINF